MDGGKESPGTRDCRGDGRVSAAELQGIMEGVMSGVEEMQSQAALDIRRLTKTSSRNRRQLSAAVPPLVAMLRSGRASTCEAAILALLNLAVKDERNKISIVEAGALEPLLVFLDSTNSCLREYAAASFFTLSASYVNKTRISASGAIPLLIKVLEYGSQQAKVDSIAALHNLSLINDNLKTILALNPIPHMINFLKTCKKSSKSAEKCCALLESLISFNEGRQALTAEEGGVLTVVEILEEGSSPSREHSVGALLTMCESDRSRYKGLILKEGAIPGLLELTVQGTPTSQAKAHRLLELLRDSPYQRSKLKPDTLENIVSSIVSKIECEEQAGKAKKMLAEMIQISMEQSLRHLQRRALVCTPKDLPPGNRRSEVSSK
ncbi:U-box domain-containing protein 3-like [Zingiber officinale]|uniref:U-box domain-containing protein 3-like n=1 Tax=Zingiber officinale TaxID=94328 RepID=UPI001C4C0893|nr:U-box domain-containing protein 3-like [Zingiber officinale]